MTKTQYLLFVCGLAIIIGLSTMLRANSANYFGILIVLIGVYFFSAKYNVGKWVVISLIVYVLIVTVISFFANAQNILPDLGLYVLLSELNLETNNNEMNLVTNKNNIITKINPEKLVIPEFHKYTYSVSVYPKDAAFSSNAADGPNRYLFYRNDDAYPVSPTVSNHGKNIGLRLGKDRILYLDYATIRSGITTFNTDAVKNFTFPANEWTQIIITVDKTIVNIYIDGTNAIKQISNNNLKSPSVKTEIEFGNMPTHLANFSYNSSVIPPTSNFIQYLSKTDGIDVA